MPPLASHLVAPATARYRTLLNRITNGSAPKLRAAWENLDQHDRAQIAEFEKRAHPIVTTAKAATVTAATGYYTVIAGIRPQPIRPHDVDVQPDLRGPFIQFWKTLSVSGDEKVALLAGANRAAATIANLVSSTSRLAATPIYDRAGVRAQAWQRDPEPDACDWCLDAAAGAYSSADATDFGHDNCACTAVPEF